MSHVGIGSLVQFQADELAGYGVVGGVFVASQVGGDSHIVEGVCHWREAAEAKLLGFSRRQGGHTLGRQGGAADGHGHGEGDGLCSFVAHCGHGVEGNRLNHLIHIDGYSLSIVIQDGFDKNVVDRPTGTPASIVIRVETELELIGFVRAEVHNVFGPD